RRRSHATTDFNSPIPATACASNAPSASLTAVCPPPAWRSEQLWLHTTEGLVCRSLQSRTVFPVQIMGPAADACFGKLVILVGVTSKAPQIPPSGIRRPHDDQTHVFTRPQVERLRRE